MIFLVSLQEKHFLDEYFMSPGLTYICCLNQISILQKRYSQTAGARYWQEHRLSIFGYDHGEQKQ